MEPRDLVRLSILASVGALLLAVAVWALVFAFGGAGGAGSPFGAVVLVGGVVLLAAALVVLGGAGADAVWARLQRLRGRAP